MKRIMICGLALALGGSALAMDRTDLDQRVRALTAGFEALQQQPDKCIPAEVLRRAQGIILLGGTRAGLVFAYQGGGGIAMTKDPKTGKWGPVAFVQGGEGSLGPQIGGEQNFTAIVLTDPNAVRALAGPKVEFGSEARATAGGASAGAVADTPRDTLAAMIYDDHKGFYVGATIKSGAITPRDEANHVYYDRMVSQNDIMFGKAVSPTPAAIELAAKIAEYSNVKAGH
jgi:lipid-binding SYLF domain-containing protein